jgi:hypothetical protein
MSQPWFKFYTANWRSDAALRTCSIAARGLWMEMLCLMHEATPRGSLLINGVQVSGKQLAALCSAPLNDTVRLLGELAGAGVFSRDPDGTIYSRKMRRDDEKSEEGRKQIAKRWGDREPTHRTPSSPPNRPPTETPITLEARHQSTDRKKESCRVENPTRYPDDFENQFWKPYPRTPIMSKKDAFAAWKRLSDEDRATSVRALPAYVAFLRSKPDHPAVHACRFLSQRRFEGLVETQAAEPDSAGKFRAAAASPQLDAWDAVPLAHRRQDLPARPRWRLDLRFRMATRLRLHCLSPQPNRKPHDARNTLPRRQEAQIRSAPGKGQADRGP